MPNRCRGANRVSRKQFTGFRLDHRLPSPTLFSAFPASHAGSNRGSVQLGDDTLGTQTFIVLNSGKLRQYGEHRNLG